MRNMIDRDHSLASFADCIDLLCCNRTEWEALDDREVVAEVVPMRAITDGPLGIDLEFTNPAGERRNIGIVGSPPPLRAVLRVDKNPAAECRGSRYCIFPVGQSLALVKQLDIGSLILIDVFTAKSQFSFSLSPKGYRAGVAQIRAWGYQVSAN